MFIKVYTCAWRSVAAEQQRAKHPPVSQLPAAKQGQDLERFSEAAPQRSSAALTSCQSECKCSTILSATSAHRLGCLQV
jgi:hypothetical protein